MKQFFHRVAPSGAPFIAPLIFAVGLAVSQTVQAAECSVMNLDGAKIAGFYQQGGQQLGQLYNLGKNAADQDALLAFKAQGPLASFSDASYLIADLFKLRGTLVNERDRALLDVDIKANLDLAGPAFYSAADYLGVLETRSQNAELTAAIKSAHQLIVDGISAFGPCLRPGPHS